MKTNFNIKDFGFKTYKPAARYAIDKNNYKVNYDVPDYGNNSYDKIDYSLDSDTDDLETIRNSAPEDVRQKVDSLISQGFNFSDEQLKDLYSSESINELQEKIDLINAKYLEEVYGFSEDEILRVKNGESFEDVFNSDFEVHAYSYYLYLKEIGYISELDPETYNYDYIIDRILKSGTYQGMSAYLLEYYEKRTELINTYVSQMNDMFGFTEEEVYKILSGEATVEEIFNSNYEFYANKYAIYLIGHGFFNLFRDRKISNDAILNCGNWAALNDLINDVLVDKYRSDGFDASQVDDILNNVVSPSELYLQIMPDDSRRQQLVLNSILYSNNYGNIYNDIEQRELLLQENESYIEDYYILVLLDMMIQYNVDNKDKFETLANIDLIVGYEYTDINGEKHFTLSETTAAKYSSNNYRPVSFAEKYPDKYNEIINTNAYFSNKDNYTAFYNIEAAASSDLIFNDYWYYTGDDNDPIPFDFEQFEENVLYRSVGYENELQELYIILDYFEEESLYYSDYILKYTSRDDFKDNTIPKTEYSYFELSNCSYKYGREYGVGSDSERMSVSSTLLGKEDSALVIYSFIVNPDLYDTYDAIYWSVGFDEYVDTEHYVCFKPKGSSTILHTDPEVGTLLDDFERLVTVMSDEEKDVFVYIVNTEGLEAGYKYLESIKDHLDKKWCMEKAESDTEWAKAHPWASTFLSVAKSFDLGRNFRALSYTIETKSFGNDMIASRVYNPYDTYRGAVAAKIQETVGGLGGQWLSLLYSSSLSIVDTAPVMLASTLSGGATIPVLVVSASTMGLKSYSSTLYSGLNRGLSDWQAVSLAASTACVETLMEYASAGHLVKLEEGLTFLGGELIASIESNLIAKGASAATVKICTLLASIAVNALNQGIAEGEEEFATTILSTLLDRTIAGPLSEYNLSIRSAMASGKTFDEAVSMANKEYVNELMLSFLGGFISGNFFGSISGIKNFNNNLAPTIDTSYRLAEVILNQYNGNIDVNNSFAVNNMLLNTTYNYVMSGDYQGLITMIMNDTSVDLSTRIAAAHMVVMEVGAITQEMTLKTGLKYLSPELIQHLLSVIENNSINVNINTNTINNTDVNQSENVSTNGDFKSSLRIYENGVDFHSLFNLNQGGKGDAVTIITSDAVVTRYNSDSRNRMHSHYGNAAVILSQVTGSNISVTDVMMDNVKVTDYGIFIRYVDGDYGGTQVTIEFPDIVTPEMVSGLKEIINEWKSSGIDVNSDGFLGVGNLDQFNAIYDPEGTGLKISDVDTLIEYLETSVNGDTARVNINQENINNDIGLYDSIIDCEKTNKDGQKLQLRKKSESTQLGFAYKHTAYYELYNDAGECIGYVTAEVMKTKDGNRLELTYEVDNNNKGKGNIPIAVESVLQDIFINNSFDNLDPTVRNGNRTNIDTVFLSISDSNESSKVVANKTGFTLVSEKNGDCTYEITKDFYLAKNAMMEINPELTMTDARYIYDIKNIGNLSIDNAIRVYDLMKSMGLDISTILGPEGTGLSISDIDGFMKNLETNMSADSIASQSDDSILDRLSTITFDTSNESIEMFYKLVEEIIGYSVEYRQSFIHSLIKSGKINELNNGHLFILIKDSVMLAELIGTHNLNYLYIKNLTNKRVNTALIENLSKLSVEDFNRFFNNAEIKSYIDGLSITELAQVLSIFKTVSNISWIDCDTIVDRITSMNVKDFYSFVRTLGYDDAIYKYSCNGKYSDNLLKLLETINSKFYTFEIVISNPLYHSLIDKFVATISYSANKSIFSQWNILKLTKDKVTSAIKSALISNSSVEIIGEDLSLYVKVDSDAPYYTLTYVLDETEYSIDINKNYYDGGVSLNEITKDPYFKEAILEGRLIIKDVQVNEAKSNLVLSEANGLHRGLNELVFVIDGVECKLVVNLQYSQLDISSNYPDAKSVYLKSVKQIPSLNVVVDDVTAVYVVKYEIDGNQFETYLVSENKDGVLDIDAFVSNNNLYGIQNISVYKADSQTIIDDFNSIDKGPIGSEIYSSDKYGGNQSDVYYLVKGLLNNNSLSQVDYAKAALLVNIINKYFPNATDIQRVNLSVSYASSGCGYMAIADSFVTYIANLENGPQIFKELFGYDLYFTDNSGKRSYNLEAIAFDIWLSYVNTSFNGNIQNILVCDSTGISDKEFKDICISYFGKYNIRVDAMANYLSSSTIQNKNLSSTLLCNILNNNGFSILVSKNFDIELINDNAGSVINLDGALANASSVGDVEKGVQKHAMLVTDIGPDLELIVSSWSKKYKFLVNSIYDYASIGKDSYANIWTINYSIE